jgi:hypothetical protein
MPNDDEAQKAIELNGATVQGRNCSKQIWAQTSEKEEVLITTVEETLGYGGQPVETTVVVETEEILIFFLQLKKRGQCKLSPFFCYRFATNQFQHHLFCSCVL